MADRAGLCRPHEHRISRRGWLGGAAGAAAGLLGLGGAGGEVLADALKSRQKQVLFVWLDGGISQLESWDPKPGTMFGGPFRSISTSVPGGRVSELLPRCALQMHRMALVRSLCTKDNSHSAGVARIQRGDPTNRGAAYPLLGSAVARWLGPGASGLPPYLWIKPGGGGFFPQDAGFLGPRYGAVAFGDGKSPENLLRPEAISEADDVARNALRRKAEARYARGRSRAGTEANGFVFDMAEQLRKRMDLFDPASFPARDVERYGPSDLGRHLLLARRMLEAGVTFVKVTSYGWDTHGDNFNGHLSLVPKFDRAFAALIEDLDATGLLENVLVIAMSEFGRTPRINGHLGRDHWPEAWSLAMAGCGIRRGTVVGETDARGTAVSGEALDIGHLFHTWFRALGIDPILSEYDNGGQPLPIAHEGCRAVPELLA